MYRLPKTVRVGPYRYRLRFDTAVDGASRLAETDYINREIRFGTLCNERERPSSLIHELLHAVSSAYCVELKEQQLAALANGLAQALIDIRLLPEEMELDD